MIWQQGELPLFLQPTNSSAPHRTQRSRKTNKFPDTLTMQQQSIFALGYYHQRAENRREAIARKAENEAKKAEAKTADS